MNVHKGQAMVRQMQSKGYKTWLVVPLVPVVDAAPPRGGVLIMARAYLQVRAAPLVTGLGHAVDDEMKRHAVSVLVRGVGVEYLLVALYLRPSVGVEGNWAVPDALGCAL